MRLVLMLIDWYKINLHFGPAADPMDFGELIVQDSYLAVQRAISELRSVKVSGSDSSRCSGELAIRDHSLQPLIPQTTSKARPDIF